MKNMNLRLLAVLGAGGLTLLIAVHFLHGLQLRRNASFMLEEARRARDENRLQEAIHSYGMYLTLANDDLDALEEMGYSLADLGMNRRAFDAFERLLRQDPERTGARKRLVRVLMFLGRYSDARHHLDYLLKSSPTDGELLELLGGCQEASGEDDAAVKSYENAINHTPTHFDSYLLLANLLRQKLKHPDEANTWMERLTELNPLSAEAYVLRGGYRKSVALTEEAAGKKEGAGQWLNDAREDAGKALKLLDQAPEEKKAKPEWAAQRVAACLLAAQCEQKKGQLDEAEKSARQGLAASNRHAPLYILLAEVDVARGSRAGAIAWLKKGLQAVPDHRDLLWGLANLEIDDRQIEKAKSTIEALRAIDHPAPQVEYLEGRLQYAQGFWLECVQTFERNRERLLDSPKLLRQADYLLGNCYERLGNVDQQVTAYRRAIDSDSSWIPVRQGLARALLSVGRLDEALIEYGHVMRSPYAPKSGLLDVAGLKILQNLRLNSTARDWDGVNKTLDEAERVLPDSVAVPILRAEALVAQNRYGEADNLLTASRQRYSGDVRIWLAQAALAQRRQQWEKADQLLRDAEQKFEDSLSLRLAQARSLVQRGGDEANARLQKLAAKPHRFSAEDAQQLAIGLAVLAFQTGDPQLARDLCQQAAAKAPRNLQVRLWLFDLAVRSGDPNVIEPSLDEIRKIEGSGPLWHYGRAIYLHAQAAKTGESLLLKRASEHLAQARALRPGWSRLPLLAAEICERQQDQDGAIQNYVRAIELGERDLAAVRRVVTLLYERQQFLPADQVLRRLEDQQTPFSADLGKIAAEISVRLDDDQRALDMAKQVAESSTKHLDHIWFGQLLVLMGQRAKDEERPEKAAANFADAEKEFRRATELGKEAPETWWNLVQFLGRMGQSEQGEAIIAEAEKNISASRVRLAVAQCYEALGRTAVAEKRGPQETPKPYLEEAEKRYLAAVSETPNDPEVLRALAAFYLGSGKTTPAAKPLTELTRGQLKVAPADVLWARRNLALTLLAEGTFPKLEEARKLIEQNLETHAGEGEENARDRRTLARIVAIYPKRERRLEAIQILEKLQREQRLTLEDRYLLAQLYLRENNWQKAAQQFSIAASQSEDTRETPRYIIAYADALLKHGEAQEADNWIRGLRKNFPHAFDTVDLEARSRVRRDQYTEAVAGLKSFLELADAQPRDPGERTRLVAARLEDFSLQLKAQGKGTEAKPIAGEAETLFRKYVEQHPERSLLLAKFLGRQGRLGEALTIAEAGWEREAPSEVADLLLALIAGSSGSAEQRGRIEKLLSAALEKERRVGQDAKRAEDRIPLLMVLAEFQGLQTEKKDRFDHVEAAYREILQIQPGHVTALNNLAMLLAAQRNKLDEALQLIDRAIALAGPLAALLDTRAAVLIALDRTTEASTVLREAIAEEPVAVAYFREAQLHLLLGEREQAGQAWQEARRRGFRPEQLHPLERPAYEQMLKSIPNPST